MLLAGADKEPGMRGEFVKGCDLGGHRPAQAKRGRLGGSRNRSVAPTLDQLGVSPKHMTPPATKYGIHAVYDSASGERKGSSCDKQNRSDQRSLKSPDLAKAGDFAKLVV